MSFDVDAIAAELRCDSEPGWCCSAPNPYPTYQQPDQHRLFNMASLGLRAFSGVSVGLLGSVIGIHWSLALSALVIFGFTCGLLVWVRRM